MLPLLGEYEYAVELARTIADDDHQGVERASGLSLTEESVWPRELAARGDTVARWMCRKGRAYNQVIHSIG